MGEQELAATPQADGEEPTREEVEAIECQCLTPKKTLAPPGFEFVLDRHRFARTILARWGRPALRPVPVSERLPEAGDCDAEGRCCFAAWDWSWALEDRTFGCNNSRTHWLPAHALPVPEVTE